MSFFFFLKQDLNRQVVKQASASFTVPELGFEAPAFTQKGGNNLQHYHINRCDATVQYLAIFPGRGLE